HPDVLAGRGGGRRRLAGDQGPRPGHADPLRALPGHRRLDRLHVGRPDHRRLPGLRRVLTWARRRARPMADCIVALTGGIASGKSEVERRFRALGVQVADADLVAREVVEPGTPGLDEVVAEFGPGALDADG